MYIYIYIYIYIYFTYISGAILGIGGLGAFSGQISERGAFCLLATPK